MIRLMSKTLVGKLDAGHRVFEGPQYRPPTGRRREGEQDAIIQAIDASRKRRSLLVPVLAIFIFGTVVAGVVYILL
ncbi:MAG: hypothetical protein ACKVP3_15540 [Hyphomicrobiaceae bacterium]